ncbi:MAG: hypothetical protein V7K34_06660 [Nostoc sp.]
MSYDLDQARKLENQKNDFQGGERVCRSDRMIKSGIPTPIKF